MSFSFDLDKIRLSKVKHEDKVLKKYLKEHLK